MISYFRNQGLFLFSVFCALCTCFLVFAGAMVTSTQSSLAVPDWPLSYGQFFPPMVGGVFYEHGHRMVAGTVGILTLILVFVAAKHAKSQTVKKLTWLALFAVVIQALLGGITVLYLLPTSISVAHACLGQTFFCIMVAIAWIQTPLYLNIKHVDHVKLNKAVYVQFMLLLLVMIQLLLGAITRHLQAGLAIPDFPLSFGRLLPPMFNQQVLVHFLHRVWGFVIYAASWFIYFYWRKKDDKHFKLFSFLLLLLLNVQLFLGAFVVWSQKLHLITSFHVLTGALILALSVVMFLTVLKKAGLNQTSHIRSFWLLGKPRVTLMVCISALAGYLLHDVNSVFKMVVMLLATFLVSYSASAFNQLIEINEDALMERTKHRPLPRKMLEKNSVLLACALTFIIGVLLFYVQINSLSAWIAALSFFSYTLIYTPLKKKTYLSTFIGAFPGALPVLLGEVSNVGEVSFQGVLMFLLLFVWQFPHFFAIGLMYAKDYQTAGFKVLGINTLEYFKTTRSILIYTFLLLMISVLPSLFDFTNFYYLICSLMLGVLFMVMSFRLNLQNNFKHAKEVLLASIVYLPIMYVLFIVTLK